MIVGEDQIIGQLKKALADAQEAGTTSSFLEHCVNKAIHVGVEVRKRTLINRGAVSVGSAAVQLAEAEIGSLEGKHILVVGSGEMGLLVAQALAEKHLTAMYVANRTYGRAVILAKKIGGKAVRLSELYHYITLSDVVISCTSAPHPIIHVADLKKAMKDRCWPVEGHPRPLILVDIAQPRDVEEGADAIDGVQPLHHRQPPHHQRTDHEHEESRGGAGACVRGSGTGDLPPPPEPAVMPTRCLPPCTRGRRRSASASGTGQWHGSETQTRRLQRSWTT